MSTVAQIDANRANAQHSTGPKTVSGQEAVKYNATTHGLYSRKVVIKGEDPAEYDRLHSNLFNEWKPSNGIETMLVEQIAQSWWRLERARGIENEMLEQFGKLEAYSNKAYLALQRQLTTTERAWKAAIRDLQKIRAVVAVEKKEEFHVAVARAYTRSLAQAAEARKIGSVPAKSTATPQSASVSSQNAAAQPAAQPAIGNK